jgi:hypothetical protein
MILLLDEVTQDGTNNQHPSAPAFGDNASSNWRGMRVPMTPGWSCDPPQGNQPSWGSIPCTRQKKHGDHTFPNSTARASQPKWKILPIFPTFPASGQSRQRLPPAEFRGVASSNLQTGFVRTSAAKFAWL